MTEAFTFHSYSQEKPPRRVSYRNRRYLCKIKFRNGKIDYMTATWLVGDSHAWFSFDGLVSTIDDKPTLFDIIAWAELPEPYEGTE